MARNPCGQRNSLPGWSGNVPADPALGPWTEFPSATANEAGNSGSSHQRALVTTPHHLQSDAAAVFQLTDPVDLGLSSGEERDSESERNRAANQATLEIEKIDDGADGSTNQPTRSLDLRGARLTGILPDSKGDPRS